ASSSPMSRRRSECPRMTYLQPASASCAAETSPVNAPLPSQKQSCPATATGPSSSRLATAAMAVKLGATATSASRRVATPLRTSLASATDSARVPCSFQLPQKNGRRAISALERRQTRQLLALQELQRCAAARRDVRDLVGEAALLHRRHRVAAADDR